MTGIKWAESQQLRLLPGTTWRATSFPCAGTLVAGVSYFYLVVPRIVFDFRTPSNAFELFGIELEKFIKMVGSVFCETQEHIVLLKSGKGGCSSMVKLGLNYC